MATVPAQTRELTRQLVVVHLSDIHFGRTHRFNPPRSAKGDEPDEKAFPTLLAKLTEDLHRQDPGCPVVFCITGDVVDTGQIDEFKRAEEFILGLAQAEALGNPRGIESLFLVAGNHDVKYNSDDRGIRWQQWTEFYNRLYNANVKRENPWAFARLHDRVDDLGAIFLCLNSAIYVEKDSPDEERGRLDVQQLTMVEKSLEKFDVDRLQSAIRIALIHHHPVLIPALSEPGRGYDAVHNSGRLLTILRRYGFHIILHGHKHNPHTFSDDVKPAHQDVPDQPIFIAAGGSIASTELPQFPRCANCYNRLIVKWHPSGRQARVRVETRGLRIFNKDGTQKLPTRWDWETLRVDDRHFFGADHIPYPGPYAERPFEPQLDGQLDEQRTQEYERTRGNLPVVQVLPSLVPDQAYEALLWIVPHPYGAAKPQKDIPVQVAWSAGKKFEVVTVTREDSPNYTARLSYWGPMLVQARIKFQDGYEAQAHVYARMPSLYHAEALKP